MTRSSWKYVAVLLALLLVSGSQAWFQPPLQTSWQIQLQGTINKNVNASLYDIDLFDTSVADIQALHAAGRHVICYFSAGSYENWRSDASSFPSAILGRALSGWPGEKWLNVNNYNTSGLATIMRARLDLAASKGCDCVDPDNVDGYSNPTGFTISASAQISYNRFLATEAHARGLCVGLKNDVGQIPSLVGDFDFAVNEQCSVYSECGSYAPFLAANKPVLGIAYCDDGSTTSPSTICPSMALSPGMNWVLKTLALGATPYFSCQDYQAGVSYSGCGTGSNLLGNGAAGLAPASVMVVMVLSLVSVLFGVAFV